MPYGKKSPAEMGHSPLEGHCMGSAAKMGHDSPAKNHHYGTRKGESIKQERKNLMQDMPVDNRAGSWMSKHAMNSRMSPMRMGHSPAEMGHESPAKNIDPKKVLKGAAKIAVGINPLDSGIAVPAREIYKAAKKVGKGLKKVAKRVKEDMTGGFERARIRREMRGGKS